MRLTAKARIPGLTRLSAERPVPAVFLDSSSPVRMVKAKDIRRLSRIASVIVLISNVSAENAKSHASSESSTNTTNTDVFGRPNNNAERLKTPDLQSQCAFGEVTVNFPEMVAHRNDEVICFTNMEFKMLKFMIQNARRVISRDELLNKVWGYENYPCTRTVDNTVLKLRQKLERNPSRPVHFRTIHGAGYKFVP